MNESAIQWVDHMVNPALMGWLPHVPHVPHDLPVPH